MKKQLPDLEYEFDEVQNAPLTFKQLTPGRRKSVVWTCVKCSYSWPSTVSNRLKGTACPRCLGTIPIPGETDLATLFPHLLNEWNFSLNAKSPEEYLPYSNKRVAWKCDQGHCWEEKINNRTTNGLGCPYCNGARPIQNVNDLGTLYPWLVSQWDWEKNGDLRPSDLFPGSNKAVNWVCTRGHKWKTKIYHRTEGQGCPYCAGLKPIQGETDLESQNPGIAEQWHPIRNRNHKPSEYTQFSHFEAVWICDKGHEYQMPIYRRSRGCGCSVCDGKTVILGVNNLVSRAPKLASEWDVDKNAGIKPDSISFHDNRKYYWLCSKCGHSWKASPNNRAYGKSCPRCAGQVVDPEINSFAAINPQLIAQWDLEKNYPLTAWDIAAYDNRDYYWKCDNNHFWRASPTNRTKGTGCPYCKGKRPVVGDNDFASRCPELAKRWDSQKNKKGPEEYFPDSATSVYWLCENDHFFRAPIREMVLRWRCPVCERQKTAPWRK